MCLLNDGGGKEIYETWTAAGGSFSANICEIEVVHVGIKAAQICGERIVSSSGGR